MKFAWGNDAHMTVSCSGALTRTGLINGRGANLCHYGDALSNSVCADGWMLGIERFQNSIPAGILDAARKSLGRRME